jgi:hypothetical protein
MKSRNPRQFGLKVALLLAVGLAPGSATADTKPSPDVAPPAVTDVLVRFEGGQLTAQDFEAAAANKPAYVRLRIATPEGRLAFLRELENYELLVREARRRGYGEGAAVLDARRSAAVQAMLAGYTVDPASIPAEDVDRALQANPPKPTGFAWSPAKLQRKMREQLAGERFERARDELEKRLYAEQRPEVHAELLDAVSFGKPETLDQPSGFPAAPPDPRAPPSHVEPEF